MKAIPFHKMVASGNDFVVIDNRKGLISDPVRFARKVCERHKGIGADGVLLLESSKKADLKMRILNADGSEAEACGNGFRCAALFVHKALDGPAQHRFETLSGVVEAEVKKERVRVRLADPTGFREREKVTVGGRELHYYFLNTGVPHVVIFVEGLARIPVYEIGREIRFHPLFKPAGANVNFVEVKGPQSVGVRTYERGVEAETLACGTGSTAAALVSAKAGYTKPPVQVQTQGGEILTVDFRKEGGKIRNVYLEGTAHFVFEGRWQPRQ